ncbi:phospholipase C, phosphocholine-specific [Chitinophaga sp. SYP-B3965]|uniref:phosphocholine-specific phospholipase C n=1 Tax=Chitinophaga sp. SYP-B3965 TaxID=2663120 RepID=UPI001299A6E8|nr:phospholipase C, phosphocholine-specific [Chitinophaga sp. SYP-B3965]MRG44226.1 phospholipase C, phosphocholine-specific [Chitinophaga sp. SYP-B3965]
MNTRRDFLKKAALLSGSAALTSAMPSAIQRALAINPELGSTFYDAEHVVFLMQENRSFDHLFGSLQGVRGFNDPRAIRLSNQNKVWLQSNKEGQTYAPFRLNTRDTKVPWMGSTPHGWTDQTDARNDGKYDRWLDVKKAYRKEYANIPLTMGYCDRVDFPFYYSLADAFTVCDHNFSSSITGTHPNRHYWMTGTVREKNEPAGIAHLWNISNYATPELDWKTYPERLEENGISWKVYQNEVTMGFGIKGEENDWLSNFGTNVLEYYKQYNIRLHPGSIANLDLKKKNMLQEIARLEKEPASDAITLKLAAAKKLLDKIEEEKQRYTTAAYHNLPDAARQLNAKAFTVNSNDPHYHELTTIKYEEDGEHRELNVPKGDVLHQFREDVKNGTLPAVSWLMSPANFSDHPGEPWFGPWYVNEVMEILLQNPEVWKKTIFILTYDENDGFFDHMPPYAVPNPYKENSGKVSPGIDPKMDFATKDQQTNPSAMADKIRESSIGLGYRVPMIIASPWTRGGFVCSELFDHTSSLQFLENFLAKKFNKQVKEENITEWRRTVCGNLTSAFRPYKGEKINSPEFLQKQAFMEKIYSSKFKQIPTNFKALTESEIDQINKDHSQSPHFPTQEKGTRQACAAPYELVVNGQFNKEKNTYSIGFNAGNTAFGERAAGAPFMVYAMQPYKKEMLRTWQYAAAPGDNLVDEWALNDFDNGRYHLRVYAPNGFYREFAGNRNNPLLKIETLYENKAASLTGNVIVRITNHDTRAIAVEIKDNSYKNGTVKRTVASQETMKVVLNLARSHQWYDYTVSVPGMDMLEVFAGHVETGKVSQTDPLMGGSL